MEEQALLLNSAIELPTETLDRLVGKYVSKVGRSSIARIGSKLYTPGGSELAHFSVAGPINPLRPYQTAVFTEFQIMGDIAKHPGHGEHGREVVGGNTQVVKYRALVKFNIGPDFFATLGECGLAGFFDGHQCGQQGFALIVLAQLYRHGL